MQWTAVLRCVETNEELTSLLDRQRWTLAAVGVPGVLLAVFFAHSSCGVDRIEISAGDAAFDTDTLKVPAEGPFAIVFKNNDSGIEHGFAIYESREAAKGGDDSTLQPRLRAVPIRKS